MTLLYDEIPYPTLCHPHTHPGRLAAVAGLLGLAPAPAHACRVLELGCASGGNLVPMAFGLPESTFVGVDLSARQVAAADELAAEIGLDNVQFHALDVMDIGPELGTFDYVIAHGLYSWVPDDVKDKVLSICRQNLAETGIAYVSYNVLPGSHWKGLVREMMLHHTRDITEPGERARQARALVTQLRAMLPDDSPLPLAGLLDDYADARLGLFGGYEPWANSALIHDELGEINDPVSVRQFIGHAEQHQLQYVADATFPKQMDHGLTVDALAQLDELAPDLVDREQYLDYFGDTSFRRSVLCHAGIEVRRTVQPRFLAGMYVAAFTPAIGTGAGEHAEGSPTDALTTAALAYLGDVSPRAVQMSELTTEACARAGSAPPDEATAARLSADLLAAAGDQPIELLAYDPVLTPVPSERPLASPIVRLQSRISPVISNLRHESIRIDDFGRALVILLDGRRTRPELVAEFVAMVDTGRLTIARQSDVPRDEIERQLAAGIDGTLHRLARAGVLLA